MNVDQVVAQLETETSSDLLRLSTELLSGGCELFSHRHAEEFHVFGLTVEVDRLNSDFRLLLLRVSVACIQSKVMTGEVMWFKDREDFGVTEMSITLEGFTSESIGRFTNDWPRLLDSFEKAVSRKFLLRTV